VAEPSCATCRFWLRGQEPGGNYAFWWISQRIDTHGWHDCERSRWGEGDEPAQMIADASDDYGCTLITGPEFGCSEWRQQEVADG
jgi:hypothetical protein